MSITILPPLFLLLPSSSSLHSQTSPCLSPPHVCSPILHYNINLFLSVSLSLSVLLSLTFTACLPSRRQCSYIFAIFLLWLSCFASPLLLHFTNERQPPSLSRSLSLMSSWHEQGLSPPPPIHTLHPPPAPFSQERRSSLITNGFSFPDDREIGPLLAEDDMVCGRLFMGCSMNVHVPVQIYAYCTECRRLWQFRNMAVHGPICIAAWLNFQYWYTLTQM